MNARAYYIEQTLERVIRAARPEKLHLIEIGCMFKEDEGLSTYTLARFLRDKGLRARFVSIDYDPGHIDAARELLKKRGDGLADRVEFLRGHTMRVLPSLLEELGEVHFALLDGGAHPEICLREFELTAQALAKEGACLVDDHVELKPTVHYPHARPFGKTTLIYPSLIFSDYMRGAAASPSPSEHIPAGQESRTMKSLDKGLFLDLLDGRQFRVLRGRGGHAMLLYGSSDVVSGIQEPPREEPPPRPSAKGGGVWKAIASAFSARWPIPACTRTRTPD